MPWQVSFHASGDSFTPSRIDFPFSESNDPGEMGTSGRYLNKPIPNGYIRIDVPKEILNGERIKYLVHNILPIISDILKFGATNYYLDIARYYSSQCNESYSTEELALLAQLNCPVNYSAYQVSESEEKALAEKLGGS
jgi:hypothetical protein